MDILFTLKNPHDLPARKFELTAERMVKAVIGTSFWGQHCCDIRSSDNCHANANSFVDGFGKSEENDTGHVITAFTGVIRTSSEIAGIGVQSGRRHRGSR
jgi:hypothetical protein